MPRTRSLAWSELKLGLLTMVALIVAAVTIFAVMGSRGFFWQRYTLKTRFDNVQGLKSGSPVRVSGVEVGSVTDTVFAGDEVDVVFELSKDVRSRVTTNSTAVLGQVSLLGLSSVDITASTTGTPIPEGGYVPTGKTAASLSDVTSQAKEGITELTGLIKDVRAGKGAVGKLMTEDTLYNSLNDFVAAAGDVTKSIRSGRGSVGKFINDPKIANSLEGAMTNLQEMTHRINAGDGSLGKLINDDKFANSITGATENLRTLTERLNAGNGTVGKLMTDPALFNGLTSMADRLDTLMKRLNDGEGTIGQLLKDRQLYENMNGAVNDVRSLIAEIKKDPKRYLNVRISIF
ncbi:MAG TPA: MlaD family protein [Vicinamibacterales bacterium]|nr:MlaD family protein [Vicinamibacterales bacterium]